MSWLPQHRAAGHALTQWRPASVVAVPRALEAQSAGGVGQVGGARSARRSPTPNEAGEIDLAAVALSPAEAAEVFARAVSGLKGPGVTLESYRKRLASLSRIYVAGLCGGQSRGAALTAAAG